MLAVAGLPSCGPGACRVISLCSLCFLFYLFFIYICICMCVYVYVYICMFFLFCFFVTDVQVVVWWAVGRVGAFWGTRWWGLALYTNKA